MGSALRRRRMNGSPSDSMDSQRLEALERQMQALQRRMEWIEGKLGSVPLVPPRPAAPAVPPVTPPHREAPVPPPPRPASPITLPASLHSEPLPSPAPRPEPKTRPEPQWRTVLKRLQLLPPAGEGTLEVQLGTWWATRIGILLTVIGAVFFGVWASRLTPPWVKCLELLGFSVSLSVLGIWTERRYRDFSAFGATLFSGGLALLYFTAFAAYALPAVRVFGEPVLAAVAQFAAIGIIYLCSQWRDSRAIASMATLLGYVACLFSLHVGLHDWALAAALVLGVGSVAFYVLRGWDRPFQIAVAGSYLVLAGVLARVWIAREASPGLAACLAWPLAHLLVFGSADPLALMRGVAMGGRSRRLTQLLSSSAAVGLGFIAIRILHHQDLDVYYFLFGGVLLGSALGYYLWRRPDFLMHGYFVKGSALVTMGVITLAGARTRWIALAVESLVLLFAARRSRLRVTEAAAAIVWFVSFGFFGFHLQELAEDALPLSIGSSEGLLALAYTFFSCGLCCLHGRWMKTSLAVAGDSSDDETLFWRGLQQGLCAVYAALTGLAAVFVVEIFVPATARPLAAACFAVALAAVALPLRHWIAPAAATLSLAWAHVRLWQMDLVTMPTAMVWTNGLTVVAISLGVAIALELFARTFPDESQRAQWTAGEDFIHVAWMLAAVVLFHSIQSLDLYLLASVLLACVAAGASVRWPLGRMADLSPLPIVFALIGIFNPPVLSSSGHAAWTQWTAGAWLALASALGYAVAATAWAPLRRRLRWAVQGDRYQWLHCGLAALVGVATLVRVFEFSNFVLALSVGGLALLGLARWPGLRPATWLGLAYLAGAALFNLGDSMASQFSAHAPVFWRSLWVAVAPIAFGIAVPRMDRRLGPGALRAIYWLTGLASLAMLFALFLTRRGELGHYASVFWGLSAIGIFLAGLCDRVKPWRMIGMGGLGLCIVRGFAVDLQSGFYRIAAFFALGIVLLVMGFLYNRYKTLILDWDAAPRTFSHEGEGESNRAR